SRTLTNTGTLRVLGDAGTRELIGNLSNQKLLELHEPQALTLSGSYSEAANATLDAFCDVSCSFGRLTATGSAALSGAVKVTDAKTCNAGKGSTFGVLAAASRSGTWSKGSGLAIKGPKYLLPSYAANAANLVVTSATLALSPASGPAGTAVTLDG